MSRKIFIVLLISLFVFLLSPLSVSAQTSDQYLEGEVLEIISFGKEQVAGNYEPYQNLSIKITKGSINGEVIEILNSPQTSLLGTSLFEEYFPGDKVRISAVEGMDGNNQYFIAGKLKRPALLSLGILFIIVVLLVGRLWGALSIIGLLTSFVVIFKIIIPLIIKGYNPVLAATIGSILIIPLTFYISHGFNNKTHVGVIATLISLMITSLLAIYFVDAAHLTGFASEEAGFLQVERQGSIDIRGLLLAGIIIGTLGILDDVTVGQASTVQQLKKANKNAHIKDLFFQGMKVGQDHISSMVNTLVLVYSGSALPLLLMFFGSQRSFLEVLEFELIAEEIVRMLVGSIGLVLAAPLATIFAAYIFSKNKD